MQGTVVPGKKEAAVVVVTLEVPSPAQPSAAGVRGPAGSRAGPAVSATPA